MNSSAYVSLIPAPPGVIPNLINPYSTADRLIITSAILAALSTIFVVLRVYTRKVLVKNCGFDDAFIVLGWLFSVIFTVLACVSTNYGVGSHTWDVSVKKYTTFVPISFATGPIYILGIMFSKISICCLYMRIFPGRTFRIQVLTITAFVALYNMAEIFAIFFACKPLAASWTLAIALRPTTTCINLPAQALSQGALNIVSDVAIWILPMHLLWKLQVRIKERIIITSILAAGLFVCIVSTIRVAFTVQLSKSHDFTWTVFNFYLWTVVEVHVALVCASAPTLRPLVKLYLPQILDRGMSIYAAGSGSEKMNSRSGKSGGTADSLATRSYRQDTVCSGATQVDHSKASHDSAMEKDLEEGRGSTDQFVHVTRTVDVTHG